MLSSGYRPKTKRVYVSWTRLRLLSNKYIYVVNGCCIPCGGANLQQGPTTVKSDTGASVHSPASSPHTTPTPNQDDPSRHYTDVGNTLATVFPLQTRHKVGWEKLRNGLYPVAASPVVVQTCSRDPLQSKVTQEHQCIHQHHPHTPLLLQIRTTPLGTANQRIRVMARHTFCMGL